MYTATNAGAWLSSNTQYTEWLASSESDLLWIVGKPGSGKSTLTKFIVSRLRTEGREREYDGRDLALNHCSDQSESQVRIGLDDDNPIFATFHYSFRGGFTETSHELMLRSIVYQIFRANSRLFPLIRNRYRSMKETESMWNYENLKSALQSVHEVEFD